MEACGRTVTVSVAPAREPRQALVARSVPKGVRPLHGAEDLFGLTGRSGEGSTTPTVVRLQENRGSSLWCQTSP